MRELSFNEVQLVSGADVGDATVYSSLGFGGAFAAGGGYLLIGAGVKGTALVIGVAVAAGSGMAVGAVVGFGLYTAATVAHRNMFGYTSDYACHAPKW